MSRKFSLCNWKRFTIWFHDTKGGAKTFASAKVKNAMCRIGISITYIDTEELVNIKDGFHGK